MKYSLKEFESLFFNNGAFYLHEYSYKNISYKINTSSYLTCYKNQNIS